MYHRIIRDDWYLDLLVVPNQIPTIHDREIYLAMDPMGVHVPSRERVHIPPGQKGKSSTQKCLETERHVSWKQNGQILLNF